MGLMDTARTRFRTGLSRSATEERRPAAGGPGCRCHPHQRMPAGRVSHRVRCAQQRHDPAARRGPGGRGRPVRRHRAHDARLARTPPDRRDRGRPGGGHHRSHDLHGRRRHDLQPPLRAAAARRPRDASPTTGASRSVIVAGDVAGAGQRDRRNPRHHRLQPPHRRLPGRLPRVRVAADAVGVGRGGRRRGGRGAAQDPRASRCSRSSPG